MIRRDREGMVARVNGTYNDGWLIRSPKHIDLHLKVRQVRTRHLKVLNIDCSYTNNRVKLRALVEKVIVRISIETWFGEDILVPLVL